MKQTSARLARTLSFVAAALAFAAATIQYVRDGQFRISYVAAALFFVVFGIAASRRADS